LVVSQFLFFTKFLSVFSVFYQNCGEPRCNEHKKLSQYLCSHRIESPNTLLLTWHAVLTYMESLHVFVFELSLMKLLVTFRKSLNLLSFSRFWASVYQVFKWYSWYCTKTSKLPMSFYSLASMYDTDR